MKTKKPKLVIISALLCGLVGLWLLIVSLVTHKRELAFWSIWYWSIGVGLWQLENWARICIQIATILLVIRNSFRLWVLIYSNRHGLFLGEGGLPIERSDIISFVFSYFLPSLLLCGYVLFIMNMAAVKSFFKKEKKEETEK